MNKDERMELEKARQFHIRRENAEAADGNEYELTHITCGACPEEDCCAPDCPHALRVETGIPA